MELRQGTAEGPPPALEADERQRNRRHRPGGGARVLNEEVRSRRRSALRTDGGRDAGAPRERRKTELQAGRTRVE